MFKTSTLENFSNWHSELQSRDKSFRCTAASAGNRIQERLLPWCSVGLLWQCAGRQLQGSSCRQQMAKRSNPSSGRTSGCSFLSSCFSLVLQLLKRNFFFCASAFDFIQNSSVPPWLRHLVTTILWITNDINIEGVLWFSYTPLVAKQGVTWILKKTQKLRLFSPS